MTSIEEIRKELKALADEPRARVSRGFFKTGPGEYGEGDVFIGVTVPQSRQVAKAHYRSMDLATVKKLLQSRIHEERLVGLLILVHKFESGEKGIADFYLRHLRSVNNWDLVDLSAPCILGTHLSHRSRSLLYKLAKSESQWERRIAIVSTYHFIRNKEFDDTLKIAIILINDRHDLIHKAVGWMLREVGKRNEGLLEKFLSVHHSKMPRTMLRYAIERLPEKKRKYYLSRVRR